MKLLSLYVDNFGKLSGFSYNFKKQMNTIYEENGWGKSTFAAFIKAMLYGLDKDARAMYTPWTNLASFGGTLVIESGGKQYRIERTFSPMRASGDTLAVYDLGTGLPVTFKKEVGEELLSLNNESFERSVFIPQKELDEGFNSDIEAKLANLIGGTDDSQTFDDAVVILNDRLNALKLNSKRGIIVDKKRELFETDTDISESAAVINTGEEIKRNIAKLDSDIEKENKLKNEARENLLGYTRYQERMLKGQTIEKFDADVEAAEDELFENNTILNNVKLSEADIEAAKEKNRILQHLRFEYEILGNSVIVPEQYSDLIKTYNEDTVPSDEKLQSISAKIEKIAGIQSVVESHKVVVTKDKPKAAITFLILSSVLFVLGVFALIYSLVKLENLYLTIAGGAVSGLAIVGYVLALVFFRKTSDANTQKLVGGHVKAYDYEKIHLEESLREFFGRYHLYSSDFAKNLMIVKTNTSKFRDYQNEMELLRRDDADIEARIRILNQDIKHFLSQFILPSDIMSDDESMNLLRDCLRKRQTLEDNLRAREEERAEFIKDNDFSSEHIELDIDAVNTTISQTEENITRMNAEKLLYTNKLSEIDDELLVAEELKKKKKKLEEEIRAFEEEYRLVSLSLEYLKSSQTVLLEKYVKPMKDSVNKYVSMILKDTKDYSIDVNFKFRFVTENGVKDLGSYSKGFQAVIALCMRLALIDCLYPNEKPFIVLDDPFVNYDDEKMALCKSLILQVAKKYQVVYFTCHESRKI